jgi:hypothetical protein
LIERKESKKSKRGYRAPVLVEDVLEESFTRNILFESHQSFVKGVNQSIDMD